MPELPEVEFCMRHVQQTLQNQMISQVLFHPCSLFKSDPQQISNALTNAEFLSGSRHGKLMALHFFRFESEAVDTTYSSIDREEVDREEVDREEVDREEVDREEVDREEVDREEVDREEVDREEVDREEVDREEGQRGQGHLLFTHLGMTGKYVVRKGSIPPKGSKLNLALKSICSDPYSVGQSTSPPKLWLDFINFRLLGKLWLVNTLPSLTKKEAILSCQSLFNQEIQRSFLGPDLLVLNTQKYGFRTRLRTASARRLLKTALMDQKVVAGIGNIYAVEGLFLTKISPYARVHQVSDFRLDQLSEKIAEAMNDTLQREQGNQIHYKPKNQDPQNPFFAYGRQNLPCYHCQNPLHLIKQAGRSTVYCPICQIYGKS